MTPVSTGLTILGLIALFWPLATVFVKRNVLNAQWLMMLALTMLALTFILLGCLFNTFLMGEYLLLMLFLVIILVTPPVVHVALSVLTQRHPFPISLRVLFLPSLICIVLIIASVIICGADMYRLWTFRGSQGETWAFLPGNWRYNLIVGINCYLFWTVFSFEFFYILITGIRQLIHFRRLNSEYYTFERFHKLNLRGIYNAANIGVFVMVLSQFTNPFLPGHEQIFYFTYCAPLAVLLFYVGHSVFKIDSGAERFPGQNNHRTRHNLGTLARQIEDYVEKERGFLNPDLSVFLLAEQLHTSEDDIIDAIHYSQGIPFGEYIDGLRIQHTVSILLAEHPDIKNPDTLARIAHQSGYVSAEALKDAWLRVAHTPIEQSRMLE